MSVNLNNRQLAMMAARKIVDDSAIGKAIKVSSKGKEKEDADSRLEAMTERIAKLIEETYRPFCSEGFQ